MRLVAVVVLGLGSGGGAAAPSPAPTRDPSPLPSPMPSPMPTPVPTALARKPSGKKDPGEYSSAQGVASSVVTIVAFIVIAILGCVLFGNSCWACFCQDDEKHDAAKHAAQVERKKHAHDARAAVGAGALVADAGDVEVAEDGGSGDENPDHDDAAGDKASEDAAEFKAGYGDERPEGIANLNRDSEPSMLCRRFPAPGEGGEDTFLLGCAALSCEADLADAGAPGEADSD